ncbi:vWA domain-containing protein [Methyloversatilis thermotolerans]|uniref:VWA domain-containing protein n=1 Tax=Methyloversatilis thermotolerans TaxID=1346290 RepID=UPI00035C770A|nr:VWA domain-containing protein [Methyloversatilis thermotolerans]
MRFATLLHRLLSSLAERDARMLIAAFLLLLAAALLPPIAIERDSWDTVVVFDLTQSMNVEDYDTNGQPVSRLAYAREAAKRALRDLPCGSRVGWAGFAEYRTLLLLAPVEVCTYYGDLVASLEHIDGRMRWGNSSEVAKGVFWSVRAAKQLGAGTQVVFVSDGQEAPPLRDGDRPGFDDIKPGEVSGWILGAGGDAPRPIPKSDDDGRPVGYWKAAEVIQRDKVLPDGRRVPGTEHLSARREPHLRALAQQVGFGYAALDDAQVMSRAMKHEGAAVKRPVPTALNALPAALALLLLALRFRPGRRR